MIRIFAKQKPAHVYVASVNTQKDEAYKQFIASFPDYLKTAHIDVIRKEEFSRIDALGQVYLDFTGGGLYSTKQIEAHSENLRQGLFGNPHSSNPTSFTSTKVTESARDYVLKYFDTTRDEYVCIFTPNASGALKLLGESYPFTTGDQLLLTFDNHNSVNGIREFARNKGARYSYTPIHKEDLRLDETALTERLNGIDAKNKLFGFPAQSNVSGAKHDLKWVKYAQERGWDVLLDAAAFVPANRLDLSKVKPDFVSISFYKIFGFPTGLGCLLVKKSALPKLDRPWFAGGTITIVSVKGDNFYYAENEVRFEDGTINYLDIPAIEIGLKQIERVGIDAINARVTSLTGWLLEQTALLHHSNGKPLLKVYGPKDTFMRGGTIIMNFYDPDGNLHDFVDIEAMANKENISLRTGCFCNPGIDETNHAFNEDELKDYFRKEGPKHYFDLVEYIGKKRGSVRISLGYVSNFNDVYAFIEFAKRLLDKPVQKQANMVAHSHATV